jgi:hypothetical protein
MMLLHQETKEVVFQATDFRGIDKATQTEAWTEQHRGDLAKDHISEDKEALEK